MSTEGLYCWDDYPMEHGCICGMCDMTPEEVADMVKFYEELGGWSDD